MNRPVALTVRGLLLAVAVAVGCAPDDPSGGLGSRSNTSGKSTPRPGGSSADAANPGTGGASASPTPDSNSDITSGIDTSSTTSPLATNEPVNQAQATPTPFGALGMPTLIDATGVAFLAQSTIPYAIRTADVLVVNLSAPPGAPVPGPIAAPIAAAGDGAETLWVLCANPPGALLRYNVDVFGPHFVASSSVGASAVMLVAGGGEAWVGSPGSGLVRIDGSSGATVSFVPSIDPAAIALSAGSVTVLTATGELVRVGRSDGAILATASAGVDPVALAVDPAGTAWVANRAPKAATRWEGAGASTTISLGVTPAAVVADSRRAWFAVPKNLITINLDGTVEGPAASPPMAFDPATLALDGLGRVWITSTNPGMVLPAWGLRPGE